MESITAGLERAGKEVLESQIPTWDELPPIDLYMDQVIILLNKCLSMIKNDNGEVEAVTKNMINNYVKMKIIPAPVKKKYSRTHIAYLIIVCAMKQVFSISMIKNILPDFDDEDSIKEEYNDFVESLYRAADENMKRQMTFDSVQSGVEALSAEAIVLKLMAEALIREKQ